MLSNRSIIYKMPKEVRLKNYPETRKKANEPTTNWQKSANSEEVAKLTAYVETDEDLNGIRPQNQGN